MGKYSRVNANEIPSVIYGAGIVLKDLDTINWTYSNSDILFMTSGGIQFSSNKEYIDLGANIDNCPKNTMQLKKVRPQSGTTQLSCTAINASAEAIRRQIGTADYDSTTHKITPRNDIITTDFQDLWFCVDTAGGGGIIFHLSNSLSTGGYSLQTRDNDNGSASVTLTAHYDINNLVVEPFEVYIEESSGSIENSTTQMWVGNGADTEFVCAKTPTSINVITVDGVEQEATAYSLASKTITFTTAPADGKAIVADYNYVLGT
jgi:hypothetical protein